MRKLLCSVIVLLAASCVAQADIFYSDPAVWAASVTGVNTVNFEGIVPSGSDNIYYGQGPTASVYVGFVKFSVGPSSPDGLLFVNPDGGQGWPVATVSSGRPSTEGAPNDLMISLPNPVTALAFYFGDFFGDTATITLSDGSVQTAGAAPVPDLAFWGVTAPGGITSVDITEPADSYTINVSEFSYNAPVPEPSLPLLLGIMLAGLVGAGRFGMRRGRV